MFRYCGNPYFIENATTDRSQPSSSRQLRDTTKFSSDGTRILSAIWNADTTTTIRQWDASSLSPILTVSGLTRRGRSARFSPDGTKIIIFSENEPVRLEDLADRNQAAIELGPKDRVRAAQFNPPPMADSWLPDSTMDRCNCGTSPAANQWTHGPFTRRGCSAWPSAPTAVA